ncbi:MAG: SGNH/GDSL hydrolase family protein [Solirubrobacteraceae bacterium]
MSTAARPAPRRAILVAACTIVALLGCAVVAAHANAATGPYVALGDSYTAGPLVPAPTGSPILCGRSTNDYPADVARAINPSRFVNASCSSATTVDMTQSQSLEGGIQTAPPQFNALSSNDALVTVGIGGNDAGLISVAEECTALDVLWPFGDRCKSHYQSGSTNTELTAIDATGPKVAQVIQGIATRAPQAKVLVVGYPDGLPQNGSNCYPDVPFSSADVTWFNSMEIDLNSVLAQVAQANGATFVDTFTSSIGHDACQGSDAWVNGLLPTSAAFPLHPNTAGEANMARQVEGAL